MSRSNNVELTNPAKRFFEWNGKQGGFRYFDKTKGTDGENVQVKLPFKFLVLDTLSTIKGYSDEDQSGYWANEVRDIKKEILTVRTKKGQCSKGLYEQVMTDRNCTGAKYCQSVYIGYKEGAEFVVANIAMVGASVGSWIEFRKKNNVFDGAVVVDSMVDGKKGSNEYKIPVFRKVEITPEIDVEAKHLDAELQNYLDAYFKKNGTEIANQHVEEKIDPMPVATFSNEIIEPIVKDYFITPNDGSDLPW